MIDAHDKPINTYLRKGKGGRQVSRQSRHHLNNFAWLRQTTAGKILQLLCTWDIVKLIPQETVSELVD